MSAEFGNASLWMKLTMMMVCGAFSMHLFSMDVPSPGWSHFVVQNYNCPDTSNPNSGRTCHWNRRAVEAVQAMEIIGFVFVLTALFLSLCIVLLDELRGNRVAVVFLFLFSLFAGLLIISGIGVFEGTTNFKKVPIMTGGIYGKGKVFGDVTEYSSTVGVMAGVCALLGSLFAAMELCRCSSK